MSSATIDGKEVELHAGDTLLSAAARAGIEIPTLCFSHGLLPDGGCRVCLVEVRGTERPSAACHTAAQDGMVVATATARLERLRRDILALIVDDAPPGTFGGSASPFDELVARSGLAPGSGRRERASAPDASHPYLRFDRDRCITCRRCLHACDGIQGQFVFGIEGRGGGVRLVFGPTERFADSDCTACGACVDRCPTGALSDCDRAQGEPAERTTRTICGYCGVGCSLEVATAKGRILAIHGSQGSPVNRGHSCSKGRYAHAWQRSDERLTQPLLREGGSWRPISWSQAIETAARELARVHARHGPQALGVLTSSRSTNEAAYLLQKLFRTRFGTNNVDCCARVCHSSTAEALRAMTGTGAASASFRDIERARCIVVAGANPTEAHPVLGARIKQAAIGGARLIVIDPRRIELAEWADVWLQIAPGTNVALFNALARVILEEELFDREYVRDRVEGLSELCAHLAGSSVADLARTAGVGVDEVLRTARSIATDGPTLFVSGLGLTELVQGTASVMALCNLALLTGSIGRAGAGMLPLRGQNNVQGNADMGAMPDLLTGYQGLADVEARARATSIWGSAPPDSRGLTLPEMLDAARSGELHALWIQGEDIAQSEPDETRVREALERLDFLLVQELFFSETARFAHLVLPAAGCLEQEGTFTNGERRIQRVRAAVPAPGEARADWSTAQDVARALGCDWRYASPSEVLAEIAAVAPELFGGVDWDRLGPAGLQWPCPRPDHPGTATLHAERFVRGRATFALLDYAPGPEQRGPEYPYLLTTGRVLQQYNVGTMTRRTPQQRLAAEDRLEIHPEDAVREGIGEGDELSIESRWGVARARAKRSLRVLPGTLFLSFHYPETHANRVVGPHVDPCSRCPQYKLTAVRIARQSS